MAWEHIEYINGNNPYICKTDETFQRFAEKYYLIRVSDSHYISVCEQASNYFWTCDIPSNLQNNLIKVLQKYGFEADTIDNILANKLKDIHLCY